MTRSIQHPTLIALLILTAFASTAHAQQRQLPIVGTFTVVGSNSCQTNEVGYSAYPGLFALGSTHLVSNSWESSMTFHPNGHVREETRGAFSVGGNQPVGTYEAICEYTSTPSGDGGFTLDGICNGRVTAGIVMGEIDTSTGVRFRIIPGLGSIILSEAGTNVETLTTNISGTHYKICQGHGVGVRM